MCLQTIPASRKRYRRPFHGPTASRHARLANSLTSDNSRSPSRSIAKGIRKRKPVEDYLMRQGRFAHFTPEDIKHFQDKVDESWEKWWLPGVIPISASTEG